MYYSFKKYKIQLIEQEIELEGRIFKSHVEISLMNEYNHQITLLKKGLIDEDEIIEQFKSDKTINLDNCYIKEFDLENIKKNTSTENSEELFDINLLSAKNSVFESNNTINFSKISLKQDALSFKGSYILKGKLDFHASKLAEEINDFSDIVFNSGEIDFSNVKFGKENNTFKNSYFREGFKNFQYAHFSSGVANFTNTHFGYGDVSFINADFSDSQPIFKVAIFRSGKVDFHYAHFGKKNISFERVEFGKGAVDFSKVDFGFGKVNFNRSLFLKGDVSFEGIDLKSGKLTFKKAKFLNNYINFSEATCTDTTILFETAYLGDSVFNFKSIIAEKISFKSCHLNNYVDFRVKQVDYLDLGGCVVRDIIDFIPFDNSVKIGTLNLYGMRLIGKIFLDWQKNRVFKMIDNQKRSSYIQKAYQFRLLKENFHNTGEYEAEDQAYISFKRYESKSILEKAKQEKRWTLWGSYFSYYFKDLLLDKAGLYATAPIRVLWSMLITYVFFSILLVISSLLKIGDLTGSVSHSISSIIGDSFYFSIITYLTVGYGDFCPLGIDRWIAGLEGFVGVFLMAYFTVAFVRKILR